MPTVLDLFCGCGGMSWGLSQSGFDIIGGIDNDPVALQTFARNHPNATIFLTDMVKLTPEQWLNEAHFDPSEIDCIVGGPPCQGFSKNVTRSQRVLDDPRNLLVHRFLDFVRYIRPKIVIMENVAEMMRAFDGVFTDEILQLLSDYGYYADAQIINMATLGVPQLRRRVFFFASLIQDVEFPDVTHYAPHDNLPLFEEGCKSYVTVWEAIGDLPHLEHGTGESPTAYTKSPFTEFQQRMRGDTQLLHNHVARPLRPKQHARLAALKPGEGSKELPLHLRPKSHYSGAYGRLSKSMTARTITRWMFHPGSGRFGHPVDIRTITPREGARLQSFTDDFVFEGTYTQICSQLGNAVPPLVMQAFAPIIHKHLDRHLIKYER